jgi:hypothetical protein
MAEIYNTENISKYTYRINEEESEMFIFELVLKKFNQTKNLKLRRVKNSRTGKLIGIEDNIKYDDIKKIMVSAIDINNPNKDINVECTLNHSNKHTLILKNNIFIEFYELNGNLESNYNIINI